MNRINKSNIFFIVILGFIGLVIGVYCFFFYGIPISTDTNEWGSFGDYFGGMLSFLSIILLYYTLREQRKENHRNWFDAGFKRRYKALNTYVNNNLEYLQNLSNLILEACDHSPFDDKCDQENAKLELNDLYIANQIVDRRDIPEKLFSQFKSSIEYVVFDSLIENKIKENYLTELEQSLRRKQL
jgi:hypothetical protein